MNATLLTGIIITSVILLGFYGIYAGLIRKKNKVSEAFASIDVQLKKRYDLIPNILKIAKKYMEHERGLLEDITKLRTEALELASGNNMDKKLELDKEIQGLMGRLTVAVENYPELKADQTMVQAQKTYAEVEEHISAARRFYNAAVLELNNAVEIFPSSLVAVLINVRKQVFFEIDEAERKPINADQHLN